MNNEVKLSATEFTEDTQFRALEESVTPLCRIPYEKQLYIKQQWTQNVCKEVRSRLHNAKTPIRMPKIHPILPAVRRLFTYETMQFVDSFILHNLASNQ